MREIAYTSFGRNALFAGLIIHVAALISAMLSASGAYDFFSILYPFSWLVFITGIYVELKNRGYRPFGNWRFYIIAASAVFPIIGPLTVFFMLYSCQGDRNVEHFKFIGMFASVLRLRANLLVISLIIVILFVLFYFTISQQDIYFRRAHIKWVSMNNQKKEFIYYKKAFLVSDAWTRQKCASSMSYPINHGS